jgi:hypothetical protein
MPPYGMSALPVSGGIHKRDSVVPYAPSVDRSRLESCQWRFLDLRFLDAYGVAVLNSSHQASHELIHDAVQPRICMRVLIPGFGPAERRGERHHEMAFPPLAALCVRPDRGREGISTRNRLLFIISNRHRFWMIYFGIRSDNPTVYLTTAGQPISYRSHIAAQTVARYEHSTVEPLYIRKYCHRPIPPKLALNIVTVPSDPPYRIDISILPPPQTGALVDFSLIFGEVFGTEIQKYHGSPQLR